MKTIRSINLIFFIVAVTTVAAFAQTAPIASSRIAVINSYAFGDETAGITKYTAAVKQLNAEFAQVNTELQTMNTRLQALAKEIDNLRSLAAVDQRTVQAKVDEGEKLQRDMKFKSEDAKARYEKRQQAVLGPVMAAIGKAIQAYAKQKAYTVIFDIAKDENGLLLAIGDEKADVTKDFIAYYNALP